MSVKLVVDPSVGGMSWHRFKKEAPPFSIALDGYVADGPRFEIRTDRNTGPHLNFNHHEHVDRLATRATCAQVLMGLRQGLFDAFRVDGAPTANVYVNDCDEDVCTSWFLLCNSALATATVNPILNRLVAMEDALDATAGAYPFPADLPILRELAWVFEPYRMFRVSGGLDRRDAAQFRSIIEDVCGRISRHVTGNGGEVPLDTRYEVLRVHEGWTFVKEIGAQARTGMFGNGVKRYVSVRERPDGRFTYVIGRMSPFIDADLEDIFACLNELEGLVTLLPVKGGWGGSDMVGGSPRVNGSKLNPDDLAKFLTEYCV